MSGDMKTLKDIAKELEAQDTEVCFPTYELQTVAREYAEAYKRDNERKGTPLTKICMNNAVIDFLYYFFNLEDEKKVVKG